MFQWLYTYVANVYSKYFICFRRMLQVFYVNVAYVAVAIHICCKRMLQMFHIFQTYVVEVFHVATLADEAGAWRGSPHRAQRSPCVRQVKRAWVVLTCMRISKHGRATACGHAGAAVACCIWGRACRRGSCIWGRLSSMRGRQGRGTG
jgi:hypothetical protein